MTKSTFALAVAAVALFCSTADAALPSGKTLALRSATEYCLMLPSKPGQIIGESEDSAVAFCNKNISSARNARMLPKGFIKSLHWVSNKSKGYVQITGRIDRSKYGLRASDGGGQYDIKAPRGSKCAGYPHYVELLEPDIQIYCLRCCKNKADCPLNSCILVNRHWHDAFTPILWSNTITFRTDPGSWWALHEYHDYSLYYHGQQGLLNHAHHIRALTCHGFNSLQFLYASSCVNLVEIYYVIDDTGCPGLNDLVDLMSVNPNLRAVTIDCVDLDDKAIETQLQGLLDYLDDTPFITSVSLAPSRPSSSPCPEKWRALWARLSSRVDLSNIHSLRMRSSNLSRSSRAVSGGRSWPARETPVSVRVLDKPFRRVVPNGGGRWENEQRTQGCCSPSLTVLESNGCLGLYALKFDIWEMLLPLFKRSRHGSDTSDDGSHLLQDMGTLGLALRQIFPKLRTLDILPWSMNNLGLEQFLSNMTGLSSLKLWIGFLHVAPLSVVLSSHSETLSSLKIGKDITMVDFLSIVTRCPNLQDLAVSVIHHVPVPEVSPPWICKELCKLDIRLTYRSRASYYPGEDVETPNFDREIESAKQLAPSLLCQMGTLSCLQDLSVGVNREYVVEESPYFQFSLDPLYGLQPLAGLRRLKTFKMTGLVHNVGQDEIVWMKAHWPLLFSLELPILVDSEDGKGKIAANREEFDGQAPLEYQKWFPGLNVLIPENCYGCSGCQSLYCPMDKFDESDYDYIGAPNSEPVDMEEAIEDMSWDDYEHEEAIWALDDVYQYSGHQYAHKSGCPPKFSKRRMQCGHRYRSQ
ncbi:hypothetical protein BG005_012015 [Podila minutissima]|nr:hypothetical protein BG005_012015 [Podila minutissima]